MTRTWSAAAGLALTLGLTLTGCSNTGVPARPAAPAVAAPTVTPGECPEAGGPGVDMSGVRELPTGAVGVRLCDLASTGAVLAPTDELVTGADRLVAQFNEAEAFDSATLACTADAGPTYAMVFRYPDGTEAYVTSMMAGCRTVGGKFGGQELLATFTELLAAQRETRPPAPAPAPADPCTGPQSSWMPVPVADLVTLSRCSGYGPDAALTKTASPEQWAVLHADLAHAVPGDYPSASGEPIRLAASDRFGQPVTLDLSGETVVVHNAGAGVREKPVIWTPTPESLAILRGLGG